MNKRTSQAPAQAPLIDALHRAAALLLEHPAEADPHRIIHIVHWALCKAADNIDQTLDLGDALRVAHGEGAHAEHNHDTDTLADWAMFFMFVAEGVSTGDFMESEDEQSARLAKEAINAIMQIAAAQQGQGEGPKPTLH